MSLVDRARAAAAARAAQPKPPPEPTELQRRAAYDLGQILDAEIDPLAFTEHDQDFDSPSWRSIPVTVEVDGIEFQANYHWGGGDQRYHYVGSWQARKPRRLGRGTWHDFSNLADLGEILGFALDSSADGRDMDGKAPEAEAA